MGLNDDVDQEFGDQTDTTAVLDTPLRGEADNNVPDESIFTKGIEPGRLPELDAEFVLQKSREDRLVELAEKSSEIEESGGISRNDVIAIESIIEDLEGNNDKPLVQPDPPANDEEVAEPVERKQPLGNPKLFTEEKSKTEFADSMVLMKTHYEKAYTDLKASVVDLGNRLLEVATLEVQDKRLAYVGINTQFNKNIIKFLNEYESSDLEDVKCNFTRLLKWADLMAVSVRYLRPHLITYEDDKLMATAAIDNFEGTKTGEFLENLAKVFRSEFINSTMANFINSADARVVAGGKVYSIDTETGVIKPWKYESGVVSSEYETTFNVGAIFTVIGTERLKQVIESRIKAYDFCKQVVQDNVAKCAALEVNQESTIKDQLDTLTDISGKINEAKIIMAALLGEIGAIFTVFEVVNKYMMDMSE